MDGSSEEYLGYLMDSMAAVPVMLILTYRVGYTPRFRTHSFQSTVSLTTLAACSAPRRGRRPIGRGAVSYSHPKEASTVKFVSISIVSSLCNGASWCERAGDLLVAKALVIARAPISANSLTLVAGMVLVIGAEIIVLGYAKSSLYRLLHPTKSTRTDIVWFLVKILGLQSLVVAIWSLGLTTFSNRLAVEYVGLHVLEKIKDPVLQGVVYLIVSDFISYWVHRGRHGFGWWWEFHKHHHSATEFNAITQARGHPLDGVGIVLSTVIPVQLLGGTVGDSLFVLVLFGVHAGLTHSMLPWRWGWFGKYVLYSPMGHRIHHSALPEHKDKNFGALFPVWDWMFGTYYKGDVINEEVSVEDNYQNAQGLLFDLNESVRRAWRSVSCTARSRLGIFTRQP